MWANAQRDGRPAEHRWRPLFNAAKFGWRPLLYAMQGCIKLPDRSQPLVGRSSPYYEDMWRTYCCLTSFFPIVDMSLSCEDIAQQSCAMMPRWRFFASFLRPVFSVSRVHQVSDMHSKFALRHTMCGSMVDIQSPTAEIRQRKKKKDRNHMAKI